MDRCRGLTGPSFLASPLALGETHVYLLHPDIGAVPPELEGALGRELQHSMNKIDRC